MATNISAVADAYVQAWSTKDLDSISKTLRPDVRFLGPMAQTEGKGAFLGAVQRMFPILKSIDVRAKFVSQDQVMLAYDFVCSAPIGSCRTADLLTFKDGLIARSEVFFDPRPFEITKKGTVK